MSLMKGQHKSFQTLKTLDYAIPLMANKEPPYGPLYNLLTRELEVLRTYLADALSKGWI